MSTLTDIKPIFILFILCCSNSYAEERRYISDDVSACASLQFNCKSHEEAFFDRQGCGCLTHDEFEYRYLNYKTESCLTFRFTCETGEYPFFNQQGCGCRKPLIAPKCEAAIDTSIFQQIKLAEAGITFTIPQTWKQQNDQLLWSLDDNDSVQFGFRWQKVPTEWQPDYLLPTNSTILKFSLLNLAWEYGLLYLIKIDNLALLQSVPNTFLATSKSVTTTKKNNVLIDSMLAVEINPKTSQPVETSTNSLKIASVNENKSHQIVLSDIIPITSGRDVPMTIENTTVDRSTMQLKQFANHLFVFRVEANLIYDFYLQANQLDYLQKNEIEFQQVIRSGRLDIIKEYVSQHLPECYAIDLQCHRGTIPFVDDSGCGCVTNSPQ